MRNLFILSLVFAVSVQAADSIIRVTDFGAKPNDNEDDTEAVEAAFKAAGKKIMGCRSPYIKGQVLTAPEIRFPHGRYRINRTLKVPFGVALRGEGTGSAIVFTGEKPDDVFHFSGNKQTVEDLIFIGGKNQLTFSNKNVDKTMLTIRHCQFIAAAGFCIRVIPLPEVTHMSSLTLIDNCVFQHNYQCIVNNGDLMHIRDCWMELSQPEMADGPAIVNRSGKLMITNLCGVPCANPPKGPKYLHNARWIDNYSSLRLQYVRIGGEGGGIPAVYHYADGRNPKSPNLAGGVCEIIIENSVLNVGQVRRANRGVLRLFELPTMIRLEGNYGYGDRPVIILEKALAERLGKNPPGKDRFLKGFRYSWRCNAGPVPAIPAVLKPLFTRDSEVIFK